MESFSNTKCYATCPESGGVVMIEKKKRLSAKLLFEKALRHAESMTCIDLGANIGKYTRKMAREAKEVIAFEPDPWAYAALQQNVTDLDNVKVENAAAGINERTVLLFRHADFENDPPLKIGIEFRYCQQGKCH